ncbi:MAG: GNAT family N-acetyltransferase [Cyanobacteria bacterium]|nr:GNAT family N-acetyltransferase [Cyanobacteria bacterium CG_2015-16_32_12]NCO79533.1 GNAT family N-acetyltransferase [Cyanobacteria bacterium CG_2015-22_32_23]NCQ03351.1 GNAT family N-acetyltransferase [Cyanobacteria bacterium CG_2015-09_32_10]NCQ43005.1 GNAT family N-acetyltransferase [Cyanobacteria bacterium CG_2015-04_32_10]
MQSSLFDSENFLISSSLPQKSSQVIVRLANVDDVNDIGDLLTLCFNNFNDLTLWIYPFLKLGVCEDLRYRLKNIDTDHFCVIALKTNIVQKQSINEIIGTVELSFRTHYSWQGKKKYPYVANLAVSKNHRRQGIATQLLSKCQEIAKHHGFNGLYLHVLASNKIAQELYLQNGYTIEQVETDLFSLFVPSKRRLLLTKSI